MTTIGATKDFRPAIVYGTAGKHDSGYNYSGYLGAERFKKEFKIPYAEGESVANDAQREQIVRLLAQKGHNPIVAISYELDDAVSNVAKEYPNTKFAILNGIVDRPNVQSGYFDLQESAFLAGIAAAMKSKTQKIGTILAVEMPTNRALVCGMQMGAKYINKNIQFIENILDSSHKGWNDPARGAEVAESQIARGADVLFTVASHSDYGVLKVVTDKKKAILFGWAARSNLDSPAILGSAAVDTGEVVYSLFLAARHGKWKSGIQHLGLQNKFVYFPEGKASTPEIKQAVQQAERDIISGKIVVPDSRKYENRCPI